MNAQADYNYEMKDFLSQEMFPSDALPEKFHQYREFALSFETPKSMNIINAIFRGLIAPQVVKRKELALYEVHTVILAMEKRTQREYDPWAGHRHAYIEFLEDLEAMTTVFNDIVAPKADTLKRKYQAMERIKHGTPNGKNIHIGKKN